MLRHRNHFSDGVHLDFVGLIDSLLRLSLRCLLDDLIVGSFISLCLHFAVNRHYSPRSHGGSSAKWCQDGHHYGEIEVHATAKSQSGRVSRPRDRANVHVDMHQTTLIEGEQFSARICHASYLCDRFWRREAWSAGLDQAAAQDI